VLDVRALPRHRPPPIRVLRCRRRISCRSACCQAPSIGLLQRSPLHRRHLRVSTPPAPKCGFVSALPNALNVPSAWFRSTVTVFSTCKLEGLLHPSADHGVHRVSPPWRACSLLPTIPLRIRRFPSMPHPSERSPPSAAVPHVTVRRAPLPFPHLREERARLRGFHPLRSPFSRRGVAARTGSDALLGFPFPWCVP